MPPTDTDPLYPTQRRALELDAALVRLARSQGAVELAIGETLLQLFEGDRLLRLGFARRSDYAREKLGVPARTMYQWARLARALRERPVLRAAVVTGFVTPAKALAVTDRATGPDERKWTALAMSCKRRELDDGEADPFGFESFLLRMTPQQQDRLDRAMAVAQQVWGYGAAPWQLREAMCQEWLSTTGAWMPALPPDNGKPEPPTLPELDEQAVLFQLAQVELATKLVAEPEACTETDPFALHRRVERLLEARKGFDAAFGVLALRVADENVRETLGYRSLDDYVRERLGMSLRVFRERVWLERRMSALPELRAALASGQLTYSKALLVARDAKPEDVAGRVQEAADTTWQQTERESTERERVRNRAAGVRRLWGPKDASETVVLAILSAQAWWKERIGGEIDAGEALAVIADHFAEVWKEHVRRQRVSLGYRVEVVERAEGKCAVPGCGRPVRHVHHLVFRSQGGCDTPANEIGLCVAHHLHGVHAGLLLVSGRGGERLAWQLGLDARGVPLEEWVTLGKDDVHRAGAADVAETEGR